MATVSASLVKSFSSFSRNRTGDIGLSLSLTTPIDGGIFATTLERVKNIVPGLTESVFSNVISTEEKIPFPIGKEDITSQIQLSFIHFRRSSTTKNVIFKIPGTQWRLLATKEPTLSLSFLLIPFSEAVASDIGLSYLGQLLFKWITDSPVFYSTLLQRSIIIEINRFLGSNESEKLDLARITHPGTLTFAELKTGSLIGGREKYAVSPDAEGQRILTYVSKYGIFLVGRSVFRYLSKTDAFPEIVKPFLLDCHVIPTENKLKKAKQLSQVLLVVDDCLAISGKSLFSEPLFFRQEQINGLLVADETISLIKKKYIPFDVPRDFFVAMNDMYQHIRAVNYVCKRLRFVPTGNYLERQGTDGKKHRQNLYLWDEDGNTIDLLFRDEGWYIYSEQTEDKYKEVEIEVQSEEKFENNAIYELKFGQDGWIVNRKRSDRHRPNNEYQATTIFDSINDPITWDTLLGNTLELYKHYHRREKRTILSYPVNFYKQKLSLLNFGCSRGGDLERWKKYSKVYAVEPIPGCLRHLEERAIEEEDLPEIQIVEQAKNGGINVTEQVDVIASMFNIGLYGKDEETLLNFIGSIDNLLRPGGFFVLTLLDADIIRALFDIQGTDDIIFPNSPEIRLKRLERGKAIDMHISLTIGDGIVLSRDEYPISSKTLVDVLDQINIHPVKTWVMDGEIFLNEQEFYLSRLYSCWIFRRAGKFVPQNEVEQLTVKTKQMKPEPKATTKPGKAIGRRIETPNFTCHSVAPGKVIYRGKITISQPTQEYAELESVGQIGDGSCLIHTVLSSIDKDYSDKTNDGKREKAKEIRDYLADNLTEEIYSTLAVSEIGGDEFTLKNMKKRLRKTSEFIQHDDMQYVAIMLESNLIFYECDPINGLKLYTGGITMIDPSYDWIPILWVSQNHFELLREVGQKNYVGKRKPLAKYFRELAERELA